MTTSTLDWNWRGTDIHVDVDTRGSGPALLLLPALSSISTRHEMDPLAERLARHYSSLCVDWPGFGDGARPQVDWTPDAYAAFLSFLMTRGDPAAHAIIAAGHAATYALAQAANAPAAPRLILIAPTWRGPLPTVWGDAARSSPAPPPGRSARHRAADLPAQRQPVRGAANGGRPRLYRAGVPERERLRQKLEVVRAPGARFASVRFVTGGLDPLDSRERFSRSPGACGLQSCCSMARRRRRGRAQKWRRSPRFPGIRSVVAAARQAFGARGVSRCGLRGGRSVPAWRLILMSEGAIRRR